jgi:protein gp37
MQLYRKGIVLPPTIEWWYGYTIDGLQDVPHDAPFGNHTFVSVEPIPRRLTPMMLNDIVRAQWIIVGAETGNRKGRVIPEKQWIDEISWRAYAKWMTPVFMKESLRGIMRSNFCQEFPWEDYT